MDENKTETPDASQTPEQSEEPKKKEKKEMTPEKKKQLMMIAGGAGLLILLGLGAFFLFRGKGDSKDVEIGKVSVSGGGSGSGEEFSYTIWPFVNRSAGMRKLMWRLKRIEKEIAEYQASIEPDYKSFLEKVGDKIGKLVGDDDNETTEATGVRG